MIGIVPLIAGGLLAGAELGFALRQRQHEVGGLARVLAWSACAGLGGVAASGLVLLAATVDVARSVAMTIAGTAAAVLAITLVSRGWRR